MHEKKVVVHEEVGKMYFYCDYNSGELRGPFTEESLSEEIKCCNPDDVVDIISVSGEHLVCRNVRMGGAPVIESAISRNIT